MSASTHVTLSSADMNWPASLAERMGKTAPPAMQTIGHAVLQASTVSQSADS